MIISMQLNKIYFYLLLLLLSSFLSVHSLSAEPEAKTIVILGDSLSAGYGIEQGQGWVDLLSARLTEGNSDYTIVNSSISGDTTANGLRRLQDELERYQPAVVILELGANDGLRGMPLTYIKNNLEQLITQSLDANASVLLAGMQIPPNYGHKYTQQFSRLYSTLAQQHQISLLPFLLQGVAGQPELIQPDGLHPNQKAQPKIMQNVWEHLSPMLDKT